jgi:hypothetical protein
MTIIVEKITVQFAHSGSNSSKCYMIFAFNFFPSIKLPYQYNSILYYYSLKTLFI